MSDTVVNSNNRHSEFIDQISPVPTLQQLHKVQLMRTTLVTLLESDDFERAVRGYFVRVLLEMRSDGPGDQQPAPGGSPDDYYLAPIIGATTGAEYTGFSCSGDMTNKYIIIELPPVFRHTPRGNELQLNSISNTALKPQEYERWKLLSRTNNIATITNAQLELLAESLKKELTVLKQRRKEVNFLAGLPEAEMQQKREALEVLLANQFMRLPLTADLGKHSVATLQQYEYEVLDMVTRIRNTISEKTKCRVCKERKANTVFLPCKHEAVCSQCSHKITHCPVATCLKQIDVRIDPYDN